MWFRTGAKEGQEAVSATSIYGVCTQHEGVTRAVPGGYRWKLHLQCTQVYSQGFRTSQGGHGTDGWIGGFVRNSVSIK